MERRAKISKSFPRGVRLDIGYAIYAAQSGETDPSARALKGFGGAKVIEIVAPYAGDTWRAVYTVAFENAVYVLHAFQKKSKSGCSNAKTRDRLDPPAVFGGRARPPGKAELNMATKTGKPPPTDGSGNIFADLGIVNASQELVKARLTLQIYRIIKQRGFTQTQAAAVLGVKQPQVSLLMRNRSGNFSMSRLIDFLTALGHDVQITVRPTRKEQGALSAVLPR